MPKEINAMEQLSQKQDNKFDRDSSNTTTTDGECSPTRPQILFPDSGRRHDERILLFKIVKQDEEVPHKLIQKAISWLQTTGYVKQLDFETILLSISLFYASLNALPNSRHCLESTLCACLLLSSKMTSQEDLNLEELLVLTDNRQISKTVIQQESKILYALDFNLSFNFPLIEVLQQSDLGEEQKEKIKFLAELLLLKQPNLLYEISEVEKLFQLIVHPNSEKAVEIGAKVKKMLKKKICHPLLSKYNSKFDVESFNISIDQFSSSL